MVMTSTLSAPINRAHNYVMRLPRSVSGDHGHDKALAAAVALIKGFGLSQAEALPIFQSWNSTCDPPWSARELERKLRQAAIPHAKDATRPPGWLKNSGSPRLKGLRVMMAPATPPAPPPPPAPVLDYCPARLAEFAATIETNITPDLLREITFIDLPPETEREATARTFLENAFQPGDRVLLFDEFRSQGSHLYEVGRGCFKLGKTPGEKATPGRIPLVGPQGVWFLCNPVSGQWQTNDDDKPSRRSHQTVTAWRHLILESDTAPPDLWCKALVALPLPVTAIYSSGGKSLHALLRCDAGSKAELDEAIAALKPIVGPLGADIRALTSVRLSRLPGALRCGTEDRAGNFTAYDEPRLQRLLWLSDGQPAFKSISAHLRPF